MRLHAAIIAALSLCACVDSGQLQIGNNSTDDTVVDTSDSNDTGEPNHQDTSSDTSDSNPTDTSVDTSIDTDTGTNVPMIQITMHLVDFATTWPLNGARVFSHANPTQKFVADSQGNVITQFSAGAHFIVVEAQGYWAIGTWIYVPPTGTNEIFDIGLFSDQLVGIVQGDLGKTIDTQKGSVLAMFEGESGDGGEFITINKACDMSFTLSWSGQWPDFVASSALLDNGEGLLFFTGVGPQQNALATASHGANSTSCVIDPAAFANVPIRPKTISVVRVLCQ